MTKNVFREGQFSSKFSCFLRCYSSKKFGVTVFLLHPNVNENLYFLTKIFQKSFFGCLKKSHPKKNASKTTEFFKRTRPGQKKQKKHAEKYYNVKHVWAKTLPIPKDSKTYPPRLLLSVFCSKSYDQSRSPGSSREAGRRRSVA